MLEYVIATLEENMYQMEHLYLTATLLIMGIDMICINPMRTSTPS